MNANTDALASGSPRTVRPTRMAPFHSPEQLGRGLRPSRLRPCARSAIRPLRAIVAIAACLAAATAFADADPIPPPTVPLFEIAVTVQEAHPFLPWQRQPPATRHGFGILIADDLVLTTESLVRHGRFVELRREHSDRRIAAVPVEADPELNLALLRISDAVEVEALDPLPVSAHLPEDGRFNIVQLDDTREFQSGEAQLVRITVDALPDAPFRSVLLRLLVDLDIHAEGAPVLDADGAVSGLVVHYDNSSRTAMALPASVLTRFLADLEDGDYRGPAYAGFMWQPLTDPVKRRWLGAADVDGGVQILFSRSCRSCVQGGLRTPCSGCAAPAVPGDSETGRAAEADMVTGLQPMDVLLELDGYPIDAMGFYRDPDYGRLLMPHLIKGRRAPGDRVPATILRDGERRTVTLVLDRFRDADAYIPEAFADDGQDYIVEGGLVLYEMTGRWLRAHGHGWGTRVDSRLVQLYHTRRLEPDRPGDRVVLLSAVLPHAVNIGYQELRNERVTAVNGTPIRNLEDIFDILDRDRHIARLTLHGIHVDIVLEPDTVAAANHALQHQYNIPVLRRRGGIRPQTADRRP